MEPVINPPLRTDAPLGRTEDVEREPDGVPHKVVGLTAGFSVVLALLVGVLLLTGHIIGLVAAVLIALVAVPVLVGTLRKKAATHRDQLHPSR